MMALMGTTTTPAVCLRSRVDLLHSEYYSEYSVLRVLFFTRSTPFEFVCSIKLKRL
jgi:hypothetical protein